MMKRILSIAAALVLLAVPASAQVSVIGIPPGSLAPPVIVFPASAVNGGGVSTTTITIPTTSKYGFVGVGNAIALNGSSTALQASDGGNYFYVSSGVVTVNSADLSLANGGTGRFFFPTPTADGLASMTNNAKTIGVSIKIDALPTVSACGAGTPAIGAGSTPLSGAVTVGTGGPTTCTVTFNGTAFPSAPHCSGAVETTTAANARAMGYSATTTVLTIVPSAAWADSSVVNWNCWSSK